MLAGHLIKSPGRASQLCIRRAGVMQAVDNVRVRVVTRMSKQGNRRKHNKKKQKLTGKVIPTQPGQQPKPTFGHMQVPATCMRRSSSSPRGNKEDGPCCAVQIAHPYAVEYGVGWQGTLSIAA